MNRGLLIKLSIIPIFMIIIGAYLYSQIRTTTPSAAERYDRMIAKLNSHDNCQSDPCLQKLLRLSAEADISLEQAYIHLSEALKHLSVLFIVLGLLQFCIVYFTLRKNHKSG
jgi:hypothetical protein